MNSRTHESKSSHASRGCFWEKSLNVSVLVDAVGDLAVLVHACRPIAVDSQKPQLRSSSFRNTSMRAKGSGSAYPRGRSTSSPKALVEGEHVAIFGCFAVMLNNLAQNPMRCFGDGAQRFPALVVVQSGDERRGDHLFMHNGGGIFHVFVCASTTSDIAVELFRRRQSIPRLARHCFSWSFLSRWFQRKCTR